MRPRGILVDHMPEFWPSAQTLEFMAPLLDVQQRCQGNSKLWCPKTWGILRAQKAEISWGLQARAGCTSACGTALRS